MQLMKRRWQKGRISDDACDDAEGGGKRGVMKNRGMCWLEERGRVVAMVASSKSMSSTAWNFHKKQQHCINSDNVKLIQPHLHTRRSRISFVPTLAKKKLSLALCFLDLYLTTWTTGKYRRRMHWISKPKLKKVSSFLWRTSAMMDGVCLFLQLFRHSYFESIVNCMLLLLFLFPFIEHEPGERCSVSLDPCHWWRKRRVVQC